MHTAFCCSTLLARCLEICTDGLVLKEPMALTQLADNQPLESPLPGQISDVEWLSLLGLILRLYGQAYTSNSGVIVKTNDRCITLGEEILRSDSNTRLLFLFGDLRSFALAALRGPQRRAWLRNAHQRVMQTDGDRLPAQQPIPDKGSTGDGERAAILWLARIQRAQQLRSLFGKDRVAFMDGALVARSPVESVQRAASHLNLPLAMNEISSLEQHPVLNQHAKETSRAYGAAERAEELTRLNSRVGDEVDHSVSWLAAVLEMQANPEQGFTFFDGQLGASVAPSDT